MVAHQHRRVVDGAAVGEGVPAQARVLAVQDQRHSLGPLLHPHPQGFGDLSHLAVQLGAQPVLLRQVQVTPVDDRVVHQPAQDPRGGGRLGCALLDPPLGLGERVDHPGAVRVERPGVAHQ